MFQVQYTCRIAWGKFSYFLPAEWLHSVNLDPEGLRKSVERRWQIIKATDDVTITHFKILQIKDR